MPSLRSVSDSSLLPSADHMTALKEAGTKQTVTNGNCLSSSGNMKALTTREAVGVKPVFVCCWMPFLHGESTKSIINLIVNVVISRGEVQILTLLK